MHQRCVTIIKILISNGQGDFPQIVSTFKTWERQLCKALETWGQLTAGSPLAKHSKDSVTSKTNHKTHNRPKDTILLQRVMKQSTWGKGQKTEVQPVGANSFFKLLLMCHCVFYFQCFICIHCNSKGVNNIKLFKLQHKFIFDFFFFFQKHDKWVCVRCVQAYSL